MAEKNEFATQFAQKILIFRNAQNKQNVVLNKLWKCLETARKSFWFLFLPWQQLVMARVEVILSEKLLLVFHCFTNKMVIIGVIFRFVKNKVIALSFEGF